MTAEMYLPIAIAAVYLWIGFVCAISFMEAWLKFRAPGITIPLGLGIGRLVFNALNKIEWFLTLTIIASFFISKETLFTFDKITFYIPVVLLINQTFWLLPVLDARAEMHIKGEKVAPSKLHFYYVGMEAVKIISLFLFSITLFK